jgi:hypothetical protein
MVRWPAFLLSLTMIGMGVSFAAAQEVIPPKMPAKDPALVPTLPDNLFTGTASVPPTDFLSTIGGPAATPAANRPDHFTPYMLGDFVGPVANMFSDVKIAEGESPRPTDRVFIKTNYYNNLNKDRWTDPTEPIHNVDLYSYVFGFEKTIMDGRMSLGLRVPFYTLDAQAKDFVVTPTVTSLGIGPNRSPTVTPVASPGGPGFTTTQFGNISAIAKAVLMEDTETGSLISAGATLSFPTSSSKLINPGSSLLAFMQPYGGFILNRGDFYLQGFSSITLPLASPESIVMFNDFGVGYWLYRSPNADRWLTAVVPTFEVHVATPLRQADPSVSIFGLTDGLKLSNVVNLTLGSTFEFARRTTLGIAAVVPVTGPKPFDLEAIAQLNYRF